MIIQGSENISLEVYFNPANREQGFEDDIRFRIYEFGPENLRKFIADETSFLVTGEQTERLAAAGRAAHVASHRLKHNPKWSTVPERVHRRG